MMGRGSWVAAARLLCAAATAALIPARALAQQPPPPQPPTSDPAQLDPNAPLAPMPDLGVDWPDLNVKETAPQPGAPPFVEEGDAVAPGQTLCILEAMKLMNEVKADVEGIVRTISVENAQPVEFGQLLFELEPLNGRPLDAL